MRPTLLTPALRAIRAQRGFLALVAACAVAACSEGGITSPPTLPAVTVEQSAAAANANAPTEPQGPHIAVGPVTNGANHTGSLTVAGQVDTWTFTATTGQYISAEIGLVSGTNFVPWIRIVDPNGATIGNSWNTSAALIGVAATASGTYSVLIASADGGHVGTGSYQFSVGILPGAFTVSPGDEGGAMTVGANQTGSLTVGDQDIWSFNAGVGDAILLSVGRISGTNFNPWIRLVAPNGALVGNAWNTDAAQIQINAPQAGTYTVIVSTANFGNAGTGDYRLILAQSPGTVTVPVGDEGGPMTNGFTHTGTLTTGDLDQWTFTANVGDMIILSAGLVSGTNFNPWIRLLAPNGAIVGNAWNSQDAQIQYNATVAGTYSVVVSTANFGNAGTGNYTLVLAHAPGAVSVSPGDEGGALSNGANTPGNLFVGDLDVFTFSTTQGFPMAISIGMTSGTNFNPWIRLIAPNGALIGNAWNTTVAQINVIAPLTGTYTVVVSTANFGNAGTGAYVLNLQKSGAFVVSPGDEGGAMTNGANTAGTITVGDLDRWTFSANQGDYIAVNVGALTGTNFNPWIRLVSPTGQIIGNAWNATVATVNVVAPATGTYTVAIGTANFGNAGTGTYSLRLAKAPGAFVVPAGDDGGPITNGTFNGSITTGDLDMFSFNATTGASLKVIATLLTGSNFNPWIRLVAPNGALVGNLWGATGATINLTAPQTGTYTVIVGTANFGNAGTGTYSLALTGANLGPNPGGAPVASSSQ
ncbi:MAG: pre-peptidase C-terminal domain-containing protein [Gemmatimonadaceae bacterium]